MRAALAALLVACSAALALADSVRLEELPPEARRLVALMAGVDSIRDVIAFPKTQRAQDLLVQAPSPVEEKQLRELGIRLTERSREKPKT
ncbi:MAG: hypothetical protein E6H77_04880 [Betaproteobacteria bacterium]|nr:MAG: hypothetical protein E6H77_04880 [Betaproteobacteria bacterium]